MFTRIKGASIRARLEYVRKNHGEDILQEIISSLKPDFQESLGKQISPLSFYPLELNARLDEAISKVIEPGNPVEAYRRLGRESAEANLTSVHKTFVFGDNPHKVLKRYPSVRRTYYTDGTGTYEKTGEKSGHLKLEDSDFTLQDDESTAGYFERGIELMGGRNVKVEVKRSARQCEYFFSWE